MLDVTHIDEVFEKVASTEPGLSGGEFESCTFKNCDFSNGDLTGSLFTDCHFVTTVTWAWPGSVMPVCEIYPSWTARWSGSTSPSCLPFLFAVNFEKCALDYSHFIKNKLKKNDIQGMQHQGRQIYGGGSIGCVFQQLRPVEYHFQSHEPEPRRFQDRAKLLDKPRNEHRSKSEIFPFRNSRVVEPIRFGNRMR